MLKRIGVKFVWDSIKFDAYSFGTISFWCQFEGHSFEVVLKDPQNWGAFVKRPSNLRGVWWWCYEWHWNELITVIRFQIAINYQSSYCLEALNFCCWHLELSIMEICWIDNKTQQCNANIFEHYKKWFTDTGTQWFIEDRPPHLWIIRDGVQIWNSVLYRH